MSERLDAARRLELSGVEEVEGRVEGTFRTVKVAMEDHGLERTVKLDVGVAVRWETIGRYQAINDPDVVQTGDSDFDLAITVLAVDGAEPTVRGIFASEEMRQSVQAFFKAFPFARIEGRTVTIPRVAAQKAETSACLEQGTKLVLALRAAIARAPVLPAEAPPMLRPPEDQGDVIYGTGVIVALCAFVILPRGYWAWGFGIGAAVSALMYWLSKRRW